MVGKNSNQSISLHVARTRLTRAVFGFVAFVASILACYTLFGWILPSYNASVLQYLLYAAILMDFFLIAAVPHIEGTWQEPVHNMAAWGMVYMVPVAMLAAQLWALSPVSRMITTLLTVVVGVLLALALLRREKYRAVFLYFQSAYLATFSTFLLVVAYL